MSLTLFQKTWKTSFPLLPRKASKQMNKQKRRFSIPEKMAHDFWKKHSNVVGISSFLSKYLLCLDFVIERSHYVSDVIDSVSEERLMNVSSLRSTMSGCF